MVRTLIQFHYTRIRGLGGDVDTTMDYNMQIRRSQCHPKVNQKLKNIQM